MQGGSSFVGTRLSLSLRKLSAGTRTVVEYPPSLLIKGSRQGAKPLGNPLPFSGALPPLASSARKLRSRQCLSGSVPQRCPVRRIAPCPRRPSSVVGSYLSFDLLFPLPPPPSELSSPAERSPGLRTGLRGGALPVFYYRAPSAWQAPPRGRIPLGRRRLRPPAPAGGHARGAKSRWPLELDEQAAGETKSPIKQGKKK